ncbi:MAG: AEC family transporter [Prolixibacteraceae bacterium]
MISSFLVAFKTILPLFLIILAGVVLFKLKTATMEWADVLNKYALKIGFPALIFSALVKMEFSFTEHATLIYANSIYLILCMLLAFPVGAFFKTSTKTRQSLILLLAFGNITYLGIPVIVSTLGDIATGPAVLIAAMNLFWMFSLSLILIEVAGDGKFEFKTILTKLVTNPLLIAVFLGLIGSALKIPTQNSFMKSLDLIAQSVTALVLLSLGIFMGSQKLGHLKEWVPVFGLSLAILVVLPAIFFFFLRFTRMDSVSFRCSVFDAAMPSGLTAYALSHQYGLNTKLAGRLVVISTFLSLLILPVWIALTA